MQLLFIILFEIIWGGLLWYCIRSFLGIIKFLYCLRHADKNFTYRETWNFLWFPFGYRIYKEKDRIEIIIDGIMECRYGFTNDDEGDKIVTYEKQGL